MGNVIFPSSTSPGLRPLEGGGRLINAYAEKLGEGAPAQYVIRRTPGLTRFATVDPQTENNYRGGIFTDPNVFFAVQDNLKRTNSAGVVTQIGTLTGDGPVFFARNNRTPTPDHVAVTENGAFTFTTSSVTALVEPDLPVPNSVTFLDGFFFFGIADGRCFASGLNDISVSSLDTIQTEAKSDSLVRALAFDRDLFLFGENNTEVWGGEINPVGFPFNRVAVFWRGLLAPKAIAGWEDGFAVALMWAADDFRVHKLVGYGSEAISPPELDNLIQDLEDKSVLEASVYVVGGHPVWTLTANPFWSYSYDLTTETWFERRSYLDTHWKLSGNTVQAFGKWIGGEHLTGNLLWVDKDVYTEDSEPLIWEVESIAMEAFPLKVRSAMVDFNFVRGTGVANGLEPIERDPMVEVQWTNDGGNNWSLPMIRPLGPQAMTNGLVRVTRTGTSQPQGRRWKLKVSDPVYVGLLSGEMAAEQRAA